MNYTYIVRCKDDTLYCGWTNNLEKRMASHNAGKGAKYTRNRHPVELVYYETFDTKEEAMSREYAIKKLSRKEKQKLINKQSEYFNWQETIPANFLCCISNRNNRKKVGYNVWEKVQFYDVKYWINYLISCIQGSIIDIGNIVYY